MNTSLHWDRQDLADYFLDLLPSADCRELEIHLAECETCATLAVRLHESWESLEQEMSPDAFARTIRESVWQTLVSALQTKAETLEGQAVLWLQEMKDQADRLSSVILFPTNMQPVLTLGGPQQETDAASPPRPVMVIGPTGFPEPVIQMEDQGRQLFVEFPQAQHQARPEVFLVFTTQPLPSQRLELEWRQGAWGWRGTAPQNEFVLVVGVPF